MDEPPPIAGISHLSLSVRDLERSLAFYRDVLGLTVFVEPFDGQVFEGREVLLAAGRIVVGLQAHDANDANDFDPRRTGLDHLAFHLKSYEDLVTWAHRLTELGIDHSEIKTGGVFGHMIELRDPDGIQLELYTTKAPQS